MNTIQKLLFVLAMVFSSSSFACTLFSIGTGIDQDGMRIYVGNNGDSVDGTYGYYYVEPGEEGKYGAVYFGSETDKQSGINEYGLFYANAGIPYWSSYF